MIPKYSLETCWECGREGNCIIVMDYMGHPIPICIKCIQGKIKGREMA